jgi:hypothetical protein
MASARRDERGWGWWWGVGDWGACLISEKHILISPIHNRKKNTEKVLGIVQCCGCHKMLGSFLKTSLCLWTLARHYNLVKLQAGGHKQN